MSNISKMPWQPSTPRPRRKGWSAPGAHDPWEYNSIPWADREWMKNQQTDQERAALARSITGGVEPPEEE